MPAERIGGSESKLRVGLPEPVMTGLKEGETNDDSNLNGRLHLNGDIRRNIINAGAHLYESPDIKGGPHSNGGFDKNGEPYIIGTPQINGVSHIKGGPPFPTHTGAQVRRKSIAPILTRRIKFCYGVGHVLNDLCASMWFTYLLIFFEKVLLFPATTAGLILLVGQLADGIVTPIVGILIDMENKIPLCANFGRRKVWHLIGTLCVAISFPFIFSPSYGLEDASLIAQTIYYSVFVIVFQFGWASVQIAHMALIPDLAPLKSQNTELNSIRHMFTVMSNVSVYGITYLVLNFYHTTDLVEGGVLGETTFSNNSFINETAIAVLEGNNWISGSITASDETCASSDTSLQPKDIGKFRIISLVCVGIGLLFSAIFHIGVTEPPYVCPKRSGRQEARMRKLDWFKQVPFYIVAVMYMATRLFNNLYQVYIPLFVQDTLCLAKTAVATIPFTMYIAGFICAGGIKHFNKHVTRKATFGTGCFFGLAGCIWVYFDGSRYHEAFVTWGIFLVAVLLGSGGSMLLITSMAITADLIGKNTEGGAFVYGLMSLVDKISNGIIIMIIQSSNTGMPSYYTDIIAWTCGGSCVVGLMVTVALLQVNVKQRRGVAMSVCSLDTESSEEEESSPGCSTPPSEKGSCHTVVVEATASMEIIATVLESHTKEDDVLEILR